jgi:hypothetical protein
MLDKRAVLASIYRVLKFGGRFFCLAPHADYVWYRTMAPLFGFDRSKLSGTWKLVAFMTEDINNKVRENVCDRQAEGYLTFTAAGRVFGFATTKGGEPLANTPGSSDASRPIISYSGNYRFQESDLAAKVDLVWDDGWPRTEELHHYRLDGNKRLVETTTSVIRMHSGVE